ncbi:hypothetical protein GXW82_29415 [Streptacidiphilus sp. 4-A2]|nr:hypothetical protein [Streptacidiphilus sp. 4-A2]
MLVLVVLPVESDELPEPEVLLELFADTAALYADWAAAWAAALADALADALDDASLLLEGALAGALLLAGTVVVLEASTVPLRTRCSPG